MLVVRATKKVLRSLPETAGEAEASDTALGDWYVNRLVVDRRPLLILVSSASRLAMLTPARDVKQLPNRIGDMIAWRLERLGVEARLIEAERVAMIPVRVGRTRDRSVTGQMVDFAKAVPYYLPVDGWNEADLRVAEDRLADTPCVGHRSYDETIFPFRTAPSLLRERWGCDRKVD